MESHRGGGGRKYEQKLQQGSRDPGSQPAAPGRRRDVSVGWKVGGIAKELLGQCSFSCLKSSFRLVKGQKSTLGIRPAKETIQKIWEVGYGVGT